jgi:hypothetical protein
MARDTIKVLNLPVAGWHKYKSRRRAMFGKAIRELHGMKTTSGHRIDIQIRQGINARDFMLVGRLVSNSLSDGENRQPSLGPALS